MLVDYIHVEVANKSIYSLSIYDGLLFTEVFVLYVLSEFMLICTRSRYLSSLYFRKLSNRPFGIAEMKRATTMKNI
jgi:hypothetical protein